MVRRPHPTGLPPPPHGRAPWRHHKDRTAAGDTPRPRLRVAAGAGLAAPPSVPQVQAGDDVHTHGRCGRGQLRSRREHLRLPGLRPPRPMGQGNRPERRLTGPRPRNRTRTIGRSEATDLGGTASHRGRAPTTPAKDNAPDSRQRRPPGASAAPQRDGPPAPRDETVSGTNSQPAHWIGTHPVWHGETIPSRATGIADYAKAPAWSSRPGPRGGRRRQSGRCFFVEVPPQSATRDRPPVESVHQALYR